MWIVVITLAHETPIAYGPFNTRADAERWSASCELSDRNDIHIVSAYRPGR